MLQSAKVKKGWTNCTVFSQAVNKKENKQSFPNIKLLRDIAPERAAKINYLMEKKNLAKPEALIRGLVITRKPRKLITEELLVLIRLIVWSTFALKTIQSSLNYWAYHENWNIKYLKLGDSSEWISNPLIVCICFCKCILCFLVDFK